MTTVAATHTRKNFEGLHRVLLVSMTSVWLLTVGLKLSDVVMLDDLNGTIPEIIPAAFFVVGILAIWLLGRFTIPRRDLTTTVEDFWQSPQVQQPAVLVTFLLECCGTLASLWTVLSGSWLTASVGLLAIFVFLISGPTQLEQRVD